MFKSFAFFVLFLNSIDRTQASECGQASLANGLIQGGVQSKKDQWPFVVSLHKNGIFFCAGTLISKEHVLTAAGCILPKGLRKAVKAKDITVCVGQYDLKKITTSNQVSVSEVRIHPDWSTQRMNIDADLAILFLGEVVGFTNYIQPACLPRNASINSQKIGYIAGWGRSEVIPRSDKNEHIFRHVRLTAVDEYTCLTTNPTFVHIVSRRTFCAGGGNKGPCVGDSGAGFFVKTENYWTLKGITSASLVIRGQCDISNFAVFTDVFKYYNWIQNIVENKTLLN